MCGISGLFTSRISGDERRLIEYATTRQICRGPDHQAIESVASPSATLVLGHCRLAILDLSPEAHQPMWDHERRVCLVFNGEIYNYLEVRQELIALGRRFVTRSDSEVILEAYKEWGTDSFEHLNGMFAFGLYDQATEKLYLVRDRFGVKPLYYVLGNDRLHFASMPEAIARPLRLAPDPNYLSHGLRYWVYDYGEISPFEGMKALAPGHYLEASLDERGRILIGRRSYYSLDQRIAGAREQIDGLSEHDLLDRFTTLFDRSIELRLRSDVPVGVSLSGGLDSSTVAAIASGRGKVTGFTFGHPDDPATEGAQAEEMSRHIGLDVRYVRPAIDEVIRAFFATIDAQGAPFPSGSVVGQYMMYAVARDAGVKVVLGGQGGDEIFMGYRKFQFFHLQQLVARRRFVEAATLMVSIMPELIADGPRAASLWRHRHRYTRESGIGSELKLPPPESLELGADPDRPLWERQARDVTQISLPTLLRYEDRSSMAHGVESRLPFLDYPLVEFALALETSMKLRSGLGKWIVREFARGRIPESIRASRIKRGFDVEQDQWIDRGLGAAIRTALHERHPHIRDYVDSSTRFDRMFSDARLKGSPSAFAEATTLIWLGNLAAD